MSLKRNILANYVSQGYTTLVGIVIVPLYLREMGAEAYGLIGFFAMLQAWFNLLDLGLTPTIGRETARYRAGAMPALEYRRLFRALSLAFVGISIIGGAILWLLSGFIAHRWLSVKILPQHEVVLAVEVMALSAALRWIGGLYRGVIAGSERLVWLGSFNAVVATLRFVAPFGTMAWFGFTPVPFFIHQFIVAMIEVAGLGRMSYRLLPAAESKDIGWSFRPVQSVLKFSLAIAFTSSIWVFVTQTDKLILSGILSLSDYGYFALAVLVASGITVLTGPLSAPVLPRLTNLAAAGDDSRFFRLYRQITQLITVTAVPASLLLALFSEQVLWAWTGDLALARKASPILSLYALGNGILALVACPYYLQYAKGDLKYHLLGSALFMIVLIPTVITATHYYGALGSGGAWFATNLGYLLFWVPAIHRRFKQGLHTRWLFHDIGLPAALGFMAIGLARVCLAQPAGRASSFVLLVVVGTLGVLASACGATAVRGRLWARLNYSLVNRS